jgi:uncharacterized protein (UPF0335 family)
MNDFISNNTYDNKFYKQQIRLNKNLLKFGKPNQRKKAEKDLIELRGRLKFELRTANNQIKEILNNPNYEGYFNKY